MVSYPNKISSVPVCNILNDCSLMPSISLASNFHADHLTLHPSIPLASYICVIHSLGELFSCRLSNSLSFSEFLLCRPYTSPSVHCFGELFLCRPSLGRVIFYADHSIVLSVYGFGELFLCHPSLGESYSRADQLILHQLASYFHAGHITLHPSILLASYFCNVHLLGELFSYLTSNSPFIGELFFLPII